MKDIDPSEIYMCQSQMEIDYYSFTYFKHITEL